MAEAAPRDSVLIVDDTLANLRLLTDMLRDAGYDVRSMRNGQRALDIVRSTPIDLVLLDINMPRKSGIDVLKQVKDDERLRSIPTLILTTSEADEDIASAYHHGCNSYITKPVDVPQFIAALENLGRYWLDLVLLAGVPRNNE